MTRKSVTLGGFVVLVVAAMVVGGTVALWPQDSTKGNDPVTVIDGRDAPRDFSSFEAASAYVADETGLTNFVPPRLPDEFRVTELAISERPEGAPATLLRVTSNIRRGSSGFTVLAVGRSFRSPVITEENLIADSAGASLYRVERDGVSEYTLSTSERGWIATIPNDLGIDQAAAQEMMLSLVE
jgi:hypothetical protein